MIRVCTCLRRTIGTSFADSGGIFRRLSLPLPGRKPPFSQLIRRSALLKGCHRTAAMKTLSKKELTEYRRWIAELEEEAREQGGNMQTCDPEVWAQFEPHSDPGRQIYASFTDEELLDLLIRTMDRPGHSPRVEEIHVIYREYLRLRFRGLNTAKSLAKTRRKQLEEERRWPWDWPDRVSPRPLLDRLAQRGQAAGPEDLALLERLCAEARAARLPPALSETERDQLNRLCICKTALELMGIPVLNKAGLRHMVRYWEKERARHT